MMRLGELLSGTPAARWSSAQAREAVIGGLCQDSRSVQRGDLFVGMPGESVDGRRFVEDAHRREAAAILIEDDGRALPDPGVAVTGLRSALGGIASRFFGEPSAHSRACPPTRWTSGSSGTIGGRSAQFATLPDLAVDLHCLVTTHWT